MAKKANKGKGKSQTKAQAMSHSNRLNQALSSLSVSGTQLSSILPVQTTPDYAKSSGKVRSQGTKGSNKSIMPQQKLLLQVTDPGARPTAPKAPKAPVAPYNPYTIPRTETTYQERLRAQRADQSRTKRGSEEYETLERQIRETQRSIDEITNSRDKTIAAQVRDYTRYTDVTLPEYNRQTSAYQTNLNAYNNVTLPNYNAAKSQFDSAQKTNRQRKTQYKREMAKFMNAQTRKGKTVSKSRTTRSSKGSR